MFLIEIHSSAGKEKNVIKKANVSLYCLHRILILNRPPSLFFNFSGTFVSIFLRYIMIQKN